MSRKFSKDWTVDNMERTGFNGYVYDFSVHYDAIIVDGVLDIQKYLMKKNNMIWKCLGLLKKCFLQKLTILSNVNPLNAVPLSAAPLNTTPLKCISMTNQECKARPQIFNVNSGEPVVYPISIKTHKCSGICNNINDPYAKMCVPDVVKNVNIKVFNTIIIK